MSRIGCLYLTEMAVKQYVSVNFSIVILVVIAGIMITPKREHFEPVQNFTTRVQNQGYLSEEHHIVTEDGYILKTFRMRQKKCLDRIKSPPVVLQHGLLMSADGWLDAGPNNGLAYLIADACYDLWLGNARGNYYSKEHISLNPDKDVEFWQWSIDEMGKYDVPASIDYILKYTDATTLNYIGFSQGAASVFIMCSERPAYCDKVRLLIGLNPASRQTYTSSRFYRFALTTVEVYQNLYNTLSITEYLGRGDFTQVLFQYLCPINSATMWFCRHALATLDSYHEGSISNETLKVLFNNFPAGTSIKNIVRYGQSMKSDKFSKFDYGKKKNLQLYGDIEPPVYNLTAVTTPVALIYGLNDHMVDSKDVEWLKKRLPNVLEASSVEDPMWNHMDTVYSSHIREQVFPKVKKYLVQYSQLPLEGR